MNNFKGIFDWSEKYLLLHFTTIEICFGGHLVEKRSQVLTSKDKQRKMKNSQMSHAAKL